MGYFLFVCVSVYLLYIDRQYKNKTNYKHVHYLVEYNPVTLEPITCIMLDKTVMGLNEDHYKELVYRALSTSTNRFAIISKEIVDAESGKFKWYTYNKAVSDKSMNEYAKQCSRIGKV